MNKKKNNTLWDSFLSGLGNTLGIKFGGAVAVGIAILFGTWICNKESVQNNPSSQQPPSQSSADRILHESNSGKK